MRKAKTQRRVTANKVGRPRKTATTSRQKSKKTTGKLLQEAIAATVSTAYKRENERVMSRLERLYARNSNPTLRMVKYAVTGK